MHKLARTVLRGRKLPGPASLKNSISDKFLKFERKNICNEFSLKRKMI